MFPSFKDGRAYSQARVLREQYGFRGELRATGNVLRDQFLFLLRAGFDAFEVVKDADAAVFAEARRALSACSISPRGDRRTPRAGGRVWSCISAVMPGLVPGIPVLLSA